ncbi:MAG: acyl-CoA dehydrogenase family protein [Candidatus Eisenbacteria sp.]|nr:acyl-CoA dehydrogenase family protein [Candidatus Eisenbacteria bacterium]
MDYFLTEKQEALVERAYRFAKEKFTPIRQEYDAREEFPGDIVPEMAKEDFPGCYLAKEYGGSGGGVLDLVLVVEAFSRIDGALALILAGSALGCYPILIVGNEEQKKRYLPPVASGEKLAAFGLTEAEAGSDATAMKTTAVRDGDHYVLNGTKCFITNAGEAEIYTVIAMTNPRKGARGASAFIVEKGMKGFDFGKKEKKLGIRASSTRELVFEDCRVPAANLLGREGTGFITVMKTFDITRPGVASQAVGIAQGALDEAVRYARERKQFGQPVSSMQAIQHMLADMAAQVEAARALTYGVARMIDNGYTRTTRDSAIAKLFAAETAMAVTVKAVQVLGGRGYMHDYPVEKMMRDAKITQIYEGTSEIQRNEIALALIREAVKEK